MNYGVSLGALQETKCFGGDVYEVHGHVVVTVGGPILADDEPIQQGVGDALMLMSSVQAAWRWGRWLKTSSSRCVPVLLAFTGCIE